MNYLLQSLYGEAKLAVKGFTHDWTGYVLALKRLKLMFARRSHIVHAHIDKVLGGTKIEDIDSDGLTTLYYSINDFIVTLLRLDLQSELHASILLKRIVQRLPTKLQFKWAEKAYQIRAFEEPNIFHLESWLQDKVMVMREAHTTYSSVALHLESNQPRESFKTLDNATYPNNTNIQQL